MPGDVLRHWACGQKAPPPRDPKSIKKSSQKRVPEKRAQGLQMEAQRDQKSTKNVKKGALETGSGKDTKKVPKRRGWDPQKQCFRIEGVAKITKSRGLRKVMKMTPK